MTVPPSPPPPANNNDEFKWGPTPAILFNQSPSSSSRIPVDFSPPLIAMVVIVITAFVIITYFRLISRHLLPPIIHLLRKWRIRWRLYHRRRSYNNPSTGEEEEDIESPPAAFHYLSSSSSYGLDDSLIKTIPISIYTPKTKTILDCAVCLVEFEENDYIRTLPICSHSFHVDCIDIWLRSHANCPLCRAGIFSSSSSPFIPLMASRIRPRIEDIDILQSILSESENSTVRNDSFDTATTSIINEIDFNSNNRNLLLKRSYSFGFERNLLPSSSSDNRLLSETATTSSPWRRSFWSKRTTSPFSCTTSKSRVFSLRYYRGGIKSPFFRRSRGSSSFFPLSESNFRYGGGGGGGYSSSRRSKSMTSPFFMRSSAAQPSSRLRCGDPEALLSPERLSRR